MEFREFKLIGQETVIKVSADGKTVYVNGKRRKQTKIYEKHARRYHLRININKKSYYISRLVAIAFIPNPDPERLKVVMHINSNTTDNHYLNLKWATAAEALMNSRRNGLNVCKGNHSKGRPWQAKLTKVQRLEIADKLLNGYMVKTLCGEYNITHATVNRIRKEETDMANLSPRYSKETKEEVFRLLDNGNPPKYVALLTGIRYETIWKWSKDR